MVGVVWGEAVEDCCGCVRAGAAHAPDATKNVPMKIRMFMACCDYVIE
jgi:hypothetical protein